MSSKTFVAPNLFETFFTESDAMAFLFYTGLIPLVSLTDEKN